MRPTTNFIAALLPFCAAVSFATLAFAAAGCAGSGFGSEVRTDIKKQMDSAEEEITACYATGLQKNRKLKGRILVAVKTDPATGRFHRARVKESSLGDKEVEQCVIAAVAALKLDKPTKTSVEADYPIDFAYRE